jgi:hypothetical protein
MGELESIRIKRDNEPHNQSKINHFSRWSIPGDSQPEQHGGRSV